MINNLLWHLLPWDTGKQIRNNTWSVFFEKMVSNIWLYGWPWWWSRGQRARLLLWQSEFESRWSRQKFYCKTFFEKNKNKQKRRSLGHFCNVLAFKPFRQTLNVLKRFKLNFGHEHKSLSTKVGRGVVMAVSISTPPCVPYFSLIQILAKKRIFFCRPLRKKSWKSFLLNFTFTYLSSFLSLQDMTNSTQLTVLTSNSSYKGGLN